MADRRGSWKKKGQFITRTAEEPGQTLNVDLCFVPLAHVLDHKLPAVSGSSGRLVVEAVKTTQPEPDYPGQVFAAEQLSYTEAMHEFVARSQAKTTAPGEPVQLGADDGRPAPAQKRALRQEQTRLGQARRQIRERRQVEDAAWQTLKADRRAQQLTRQAVRQTGQRAVWGSQTAAATHWGQFRQQHQNQLAQRQQEDERWRHQRQMWRQQALDLPGSPAWVAILVITDNCTQQGLGLPLFVAGAHVTADMVGEALRVLLPPELQFLISDRGTHFTSAVFKQLAKAEEFLHVLIARHRPQSNGCAERFVRTLKEWLAHKTWSAAPELTYLLAAFLADYNDRPHQGLPIPGLSPNEFAQRIWLF